MKQLKFVVSLFTFLTFMACPYLDYQKSFIFSNNSDRDVYIYLGVASRELGGSLYPDTAIAEVKCGEPYKKGDSRQYCYNYENDLDTLCLFIFDADTFNTYSWEEIKYGYKILQRYDISHENIKNLKFNISYPPTGAMKNMKMYPPYGSE